MRIYLCGQKAFGASVYMALREAHTIVGVSSPEKGSAGPDKLRAKADLYGTPWMRSGGLTRATIPAGVDLIVAAHSHDFISEQTRFAARFGAIGFHPSLLPVHRGRDAIRWAIRNHDRITGGSVYQLSNRVDGGPILAQDWCFIRPDDDASTLWRRDLMPMGVRLLLDAVAAVGAGTAVPREQDEELATWEPALDSPPLHRPDLLMLPFKV